MDEQRVSNENVCFKTGLSVKSFEWILENGHCSTDAMERIADALEVEANEIITDDFGENENVIEFLKDNNRATVTACQGRYITRLRKLAAERPDECQIVATNRTGSIVAHVPTSWVKISPPKQYTEEQKAEMRGRLNRNV